MKLIVVEGLDGAGKSTQIKKLKKYFNIKGEKCNYLHFPRNAEPFFGELISRFLRGEFGKLEDVDPYLVAMIYAGDRKDASQIINNWLGNKEYVILDRYVYSNIAYQCAKIEDKGERERLRDWILKLEFGHFGIPVPHINIFLDVPFGFTAEKLGSKRSGADRSYLNGGSDIHESSLDFQKNVRSIYLEEATREDTVEIVDCCDKETDILKPDDIFKKIIHLLEKRKLI